MRAWIERIDGQFRNANVFCAWQGLQNLGYECGFFAPENIETLELDAHTPVVAGIAVVWRALQTLNVRVGALEAVPAELSEFAGRSCGTCTLGQIRARVAQNGAPVFIKPAAPDGKLFGGHVVSRFRDLIETASFADETPLWWSDALELRGEFRGFVHRGELVGWKHYFGDFRCALNFERIESALEKWRSRPVACAMDWALTSKGDTVLVEVNDAYSLGSYGLAPHLYAPMLASRWREIVQNGCCR